MLCRLLSTHVVSQEEKPLPESSSLEQVQEAARGEAGI